MRNQEERRRKRKRKKERKKEQGAVSGSAKGNYPSVVYEWNKKEKKEKGRRTEGRSRRWLSDARGGGE